MSETVGKKKGSILSFCALLIGLCALGLSGYIYYTDMIYKRNLKIELIQINSRIMQQDSTTTSSLKEIEDNLDQLNSKYAEIANNKNGNILFQINELVSLANQGLVVYNDISGAIRLLNYAKEMLNSNDDAIFTGIKYAISSDLTKLNQETRIDKVILSAELDSIANTISKLHLEPIQNKPHTDISTKSKWQMFVDNIKTSLSSLISITRPGSSANILLPKENTAMEEGIRVDILTAKMALLQHDQPSWVYSLNNAKEILNANFSGYSGVDKIIAQLNQLVDINISNSAVNIDATLVELTKLNNMK